MRRGLMAPGRSLSPAHTRCLPLAGSCRIDTDGRSLARRPSGLRQELVADGVTWQSWSVRFPGESSIQKSKIAPPRPSRRSSERMADAGRDSLFDEDTLASDPGFRKPCPVPVRGSRTLERPAAPSCEARAVRRTGYPESGDSLPRSSSRSDRKVVCVRLGFGSSGFYPHRD